MIKSIATWLMTVKTWWPGVLTGHDRSWLMATRPTARRLEGSASPCFVWRPLPATPADAWPRRSEHLASWRPSHRHRPSRPDIGHHTIQSTVKITTRWYDILYKCVNMHVNMFEHITQMLPLVHCEPNTSCIQCTQQCTKQRHNTCKNKNNIQQPFESFEHTWSSNTSRN